MGKNGPEHSKSETVEEGKEGLKKTPDTTKKIERSLGDDESKKYLNEISQVFENGFDNGIDGQKITVDNANGKIHFGEFEEGKRDTYIYIDKTKVPADRESSFYDRMNIKNVNGQKILSIYNDADRVNGVIPKNKIIKIALPSEQQILARKEEKDRAEFDPDTLLASL